MKGEIIIIGAGNWGTTLSLLLAPCRSTRLWTHTPEHAALIEVSGENEKYLPGIQLPPELKVESFGASDIGADDLIIIAVPSHQIRTVTERLSPLWLGQTIVNSAKGFEHHSMKTLSQVIEDVIREVPLVVWSGPNIAHEMAQG